MDQLKIFEKKKKIGENIIQFHSISVSFGSMYFFLFHSLDVRALEEFSDRPGF